MLKNLHIEKQELFIVLEPQIRNKVTSLQQESANTHTHTGSLKRASFCHVNTLVFLPGDDCLS